MQKYKFAFISNSDEFGEVVKQYSDPMTDDLIVRLATMEEAIPVARRFLDEGVEVILGGGGTGALLAKTIGQPVVKIARTHLDILCAFIKAKDYGSYIGLTSFAKPTYGIEIFEKLLSIKIRQIVFNTTAELMNGIAKAVDEGINCLVGGGICKKIAASLGGKGIVVLPTKETILQALQEARVIALARRVERENTKQLQTILESLKEGVIVIDNNGRIKIFNPIAANILGVKLQDTVGKPLKEVLKGTGLLKVLITGKPEMDKIRRVGDVDIVINTFPIVVNGEMRGIVATFREALKIQSIERKIREKLYAKGFVAKYTIGDITGQSLAIKQLLEKIKKYAQTDATILIEGETGTGKEIVAQSIHNLSNRKERPFIAINCSALPESLLESELFGYEEGAFTGARKGGKIGLFELAHEGTIFLDEIADISPGVQVRLLRVLEEKEVMRIGGDRIIPVDVRIISSTYKNLWQEVMVGRFRMDLYFRLAILRLYLQPLRERLEDLPYIAQELFSKYMSENLAFAQKVPQKILERMQKYYWPGNIRELDSLIKEYTILRDNSVSDEHLFLELLEELIMNHMAVSKETNIPSSEELKPDHLPKTLKERLDEYEKEIIKETLREVQFNKKEAARRLSISETTLWRRLYLSGGNNQ
ncbi:MAG: sigma 54-interacting transcriptional regulator [Nitrospirota bacterium]